MGVVVLLGAVSGCGAYQAAAVPDEAGASRTPVPATTVCAKDAKAVGVPQELPAQAALPNGYVVTNVEARSGSRIVVSAVSPREFTATLADMQRIFSENGWTMSQGEVEAGDAESNFSGNGVKGRWAIRAIDQCEGNTTVSVVTGPS